MMRYTASRRNMFYKALGKAIRPRGDAEEQLSAALEVVNELADYPFSTKARKLFELAKAKPWLLDVFEVINERRRYEQRETQGADPKSEDPAAQFFDIIRGR